MKEGNKQLLKAVGIFVGLNIFLNILPPPFGLIAFAGVTLYFLWEVYKQTRY